MVRQLATTGLKPPVKNLRQHHRIAVFEPYTDHPWLTMAEAASALQGDSGVIRTMIKHKIIVAHQIADGPPWIIQRGQLQLGEAQRYAKLPEQENLPAWASRPTKTA